VYTSPSYARKTGDDSQWLFYLQNLANRFGGKLAGVYDEWEALIKSYQTASNTASGRPRSNLNTDSDRPESAQDLTYLWTEYRYRHELCWQAIYKLIVAVIALGVIPYLPQLKNNVMKSFEMWLIVPPVVAMGLAGLGIFVVHKRASVVC
jgi:hypothetical protein